MYKIDRSMADYNNVFFNLYKEDVYLYTIEAQDLDDVRINSLNDFELQILGQADKIMDPREHRVLVSSSVVPIIVYEID